MTPPIAPPLEEASSPVVTYAETVTLVELIHVLKQAEGQMKAIQAQIGGGRGVPPSTFPRILLIEFEKLLKLKQAPPVPEPKKVDGK